MKNTLKLYARTLLWISLLCVLFLALLYASYSHHSQNLAKHTEDALSTLSEEGEYPIYFFSQLTKNYRFTTQADNASDEVILRRAGFISDSPFQDALDMQDYARYWHGYVVLLRPLLHALSFEEIRLLMMAVFTLLVAGLAMQFRKHFGKGYALLFFFAICLLQGFMIPTSPQYFVCFGIALSTAIFLLWREPRKALSRQSLLLIFASIGALSSFLDLLTVPLLTWGLPLLCLLLYWSKTDRKSLYLPMLEASLAWGFGYALCWGFKIGLASLILGAEVFRSASSHALLHTATHQHFGQMQIGAILINLSYLGHILGLLYLLFCLALLLYALWKKHSIRFPQALPFLLLGITPYLWYALLSNHSQIHAWFTFRLQLLSLLSFPAPIFLAIQRTKK